MSLTLTEYINRVRDGSLDAKQVAQDYLTKIADDTTNSFVTTHPSYVKDHSDDFSHKPLAWAPIGIKDIIMTKGYETTCASSILKGYVAPYSATCIENLEQAGWLMIGKTNMDEFACGASGETSVYWPTKNPHDLTRIPWGSSSWSAASVAADLCIASLGTDTGWSIRLPAALCGLVWVKPTYGRVSRYGVQSMTSSFDQVGTFTKTVDDAAILLEAIAGQDDRDAQTSKLSTFTSWWYSPQTTTFLRDKKFALPKQYLDEGLDPAVKEQLMLVVETIRSTWWIVEQVDMPILSYAVPIYYIIVPAQLSTNLARFDGIRYGKSKATDQFATIFDYYAAIRDGGFGDEVKRRILTGTYVLSAWFYDAYYAKALAAKKKMTVEMTKLLRDYDAIIGPTGPTPAWKIGEKIDDPIAMYLTDVYTCPANIAWLPAVSLPTSTVVEDWVTLPAGMQLTCGHWKEWSMLRLSSALLDAVNHGK